ncbi:hypothetical protein LXL04_038543 [Taraxacum kok-saghyz]
MIKGLPEIAGVSWKHRIQSNLSSYLQTHRLPSNPSRDREKDTREIGERLDGADEPRGRESGRRQTLRRRDSRNRALQLYDRRFDSNFQIHPPAFCLSSTSVTTHTHEISDRRPSLVYLPLPSSFADCFTHSPSSFNDCCHRDSEITD